MSPKPSICFEFTPALLAFRAAAGDANRCLNTLLAGLETLKAGTPVKPQDLVVAWSKPETDEEWLETRNYALRGTMVAVVDAIDQYLKIISRIDGLTPPELDDRLNGRKARGEDHRPTLPERIAPLSAKFPGVVHPAYPLAIALLAAWRNKFVHFEAKEGLSGSERKALISHAEFFRQDLGGVDVNAMLERYISDDPPTLSDLSTLVACAQRFARDLDAHLLHLQEPRAYAVSLARYLIERSANPAQKLEDLFWPGGEGSSGRIHASFLENGANHSVNRTASAPHLSRQELNDILGISRNRAAELFGVKRIRTGPGE